MSSNFFKGTLIDKSLKPTWWVSNLDWIFDDKKFEKTLGWTKGPRRTLTNYINKNVSNISVIKKGNEIFAPNISVTAINNTYCLFTCCRYSCMNYAVNF